jgi:hypothetical protein
MTRTPSRTPIVPNRMRPAAARLSAGASSMLRLVRPAEPRLPPATALTGWAERAAAMLDLSPLPAHALQPADLPPPLPFGRRRQSHLGHFGPRS